LIATLLDVLRAKQLLFLLDNCEHLIEACAQFADSVLRACPHVKLLTSSREALGIAGETTYRVPSLSLPLPPDFRSLQDFGSLTQYEAVRLFVERAVAVKSDFQVTHANALAVAQLCQRVDGIPLALELAAARVKSLSVEQIAARLDNQFRLLTGGSRTALPRQQTLRAMIDWSHNLLNETERVLFRRLAVFAGGWTLEAAEQVCSDERLAVEDIVDLLDQLVNKSLVVVEEQEGDSGAVRYRYLETIRQYAREKLLDVREGEGVRNRQLTYFMELAEQAEQKFRGTEQLAWFYRLETELDNLRAAIEWALESQQIEAGLRLAASAYLFWFELNHVGEGLHHLEDLLAKQVNKAPSSLYAKALLIAARFYGDYSRLSEMNSYAEEGLAIGQQLANMPIIVEAHDVLVHLARRQGNYARAFELLADNLVIYETLRDEYGIAETLSGQAKTAHMNNDYVQAQALYEKCLPLFRQWGVSDLVALTLRHLGYALLQQNSDSKVIKPFKESLALNLKLKDQLSTISSFTAFAAVAVRAGQSLRAVKIYGAAEALMKLVDRPIGALDHRYYRPLA
jgi:predicted ATPase